MRASSSRLISLPIAGRTHHALDDRLGKEADALAQDVAAMSPTFHRVLSWDMPPSARVMFSVSSVATPTNAR
jgi:hypothetical protein